ncbi:hypothetical protein BC826DRAFT_594587 [Russula brevipes]|nr:hypothetical protein BC826DRAFT_594587 [Russula brevipes]
MPTERNRLFRSRFPCICSHETGSISSVDSRPYSTASNRVVISFVAPSFGQTRTNSEAAEPPSADLRDMSLKEVLRATFKTLCRRNYQETRFHEHTKNHGVNGKARKFAHPSIPSLRLPVTSTVPVTTRHSHSSFGGTAMFCNAGLVGRGPWA